MPARSRSKLFYKRYVDDEGQSSHIFDVNKPEYSRPVEFIYRRKGPNRKMDRSNVVERRNGTDSRFNEFGRLSVGKHIPSGVVFVAPDAEIRKETAEA